MTSKIEKAKRAIGVTFTIDQTTWDNIDKARKQKADVHADVMMSYETRDGAREIYFTIDEFLTKLGF